MSQLPPLPPTPHSSVTPSVRSQRSNKAVASNAIPVPPQITSSASQRSGAGSQRSGTGQKGDNASERSRRSQGSQQASQRSISSSVALGKLAELEKLLLDERRAREDAENTMLALQRERIAKEEASKKFEATERQLAAVMEAVRSVVGQPENPSNLRKLKAVITGGVDVSSSEVDRAAVNSDGRPRSFLDGVGQYEREREKARKEAKAELSKKSQLTVNAAAARGSKGS